MCVLRGALTISTLVVGHVDLEHAHIRCAPFNQIEIIIQIRIQIVASALDRYKVGCTSNSMNG